MTELLPVAAVCIVLAIVSHSLSGYSVLTESYARKEHFVYVILTIIAVLFAGLRTNYNDTANYISGYDALETTGIFSGVSWQLGDYPGFTITNNCLKLLGFSSQSFIMFYAAVTIGLYFWFVHKYTNHIALSVYLMFTMGVYLFAFAAIKQCAAIAIALIGVDRCIRKKYVSFVVFVLLAALFHPFAIMFLICPILCYRPWSWQTLVLIAACVILGESMQKWFGAALDTMADFGIDYDIDNISGEGVNGFRVLVVWVPVILSLIASRCWENNEDRGSCLIMNLSMVCAVLMFIALFGNPIYLGRLANYFLIFQVISLPYMMQYFEKRTRIFLVAAMVVCFFAYSYYGNVLNGRSFDESFASISLMQYILQ